MRELHRAGRNKDSALGECSQDLMCTGTLHKVLPQELGLAITRGLGNSEEVGIHCSSLLYL